MEEGDEGRRQAEGPGPEPVGRTGPRLVWGALAVALSAGVCVAAAYAIPRYFEARRRANEAAAVTVLRSLATAQASFRDADRDGDGLPGYGDLDSLVRSGLIEPGLAAGPQSGYRFTFGLDGLGAGWHAIAEPVEPGSSGDRSFFINESGIVYATDHAAMAYGISGNKATPPVAAEVVAK